MKLTAPSNKTGVTQTYPAIPMIGQNGATTAEVDIKVPAHCPCNALEIYPAAQSHRVDPFLLASIAARESGGFQPENDPLCGSMDPLHNGTGIGLDGTGHGLFQVDDGSWFFATTPGVNDINQNIDVGALIFADDLAANNGNITGALHDYNAGPNKSIPTTGHYEAGVLALKRQFISQNYSFKCAMKQIAEVKSFQSLRPAATAHLQTAILAELSATAGRNCT